MLPVVDEVQRLGSDDAWESEGMMVVNNPLIRPTISLGLALGGAP